jgi:phosphomannomutase
MSFKNLEGPRLFGTSGIRGVVGKGLNYELFWNIGVLLAYHSAIVRGLDPDKTRNLVKSITVK